MKMTWVAVLCVLGILFVSCTPAMERIMRVAPATTTVVASLTEFTIILKPDTVAAGDVAIAVNNEGRTAHALVLVRETSSGERTEYATRVLPPGGSETLRIPDLPAGRYAVYCPVDRHAERGMVATLTVTETTR